jgi:G3E family GTPase
VTVVTGFLGAGKTTLLNRLLRSDHGLQVGVVQNERGEAGIEAAPASLARVELTEGCACCLRNPDLVAALQELAGRDDLDHVLLETSGLADPLPIAWTLEKPELCELVRVDAVITVVDALEQARCQAEQEWQAQVATADLAVVSKRGLAGESGVRAAVAAVRALNESARLVDEDSDDLAGIVFDARVERPRPVGAPAHARHSDFGSVACSGPFRYDLDALEDALDGLPAEVFRAKGILPTRDGRWVRFHVVGGRKQVDLDVPAPDHAQSRIVLFGKRLDEAAVLAPLLAARR